ncbi:MAG: S46 family peptidase [Paludibacter sp.]|nr:S46 family peptidase [Paludibacter sp.]
MKKMLLTAVALITMLTAKADEGMWMLPSIQENISAMQQLGCTMPAEELYSDSTVSLKDAVIVFGGGCTGITVSDQGLVFTNHHCGYGAIQGLSSLEHNYLRDGFTAKELKDEIPAPGLTVKYLVSITEVTDRVLSALNESMSPEKRSSTQDSVVAVIKDEFSKDNDYVVQVKSMYSGNQFFVFLLEEFKDVRFVHAPPTSIGKFGGDTDNWMWPRHTGDYSVFRVYANKDNKPAAYSADNQPYRPKRFAAISTKGYKAGDFAFIMGNPGSTSRYLTSWGITNRTKATNQARIDVRGAKQEVWKSFMKADEAINIAYASKYAGSSNYWKNSIGMNKAIEELGVMARKQELERNFRQWVAADPDRTKKYGSVLQELEQHNAKVYTSTRTATYLREALLAGVEMPRIAGALEDLVNAKDKEEAALKRAERVYKDYYPSVDEATLAVMLETYRTYVDASELPSFYTEIDKKFKGNYKAYARNLFAKSAFSDKDKFLKLYKSGKINLRKDPALKFRDEVRATLNGLEGADIDESRAIIRNAERLFEAGMLEINRAKGVKTYPDANFTMRLTYGTISGYEPADAVAYNYYSTSKGILEKEIPGDMEFDVPAALKTTLLNNDLAPYTDENGKLIVNFLSNNDITGGNSGSPIFNAKGELLGLAFDGNWEAMSGDIVFEPEVQRTINVDVRYMLFVMDKIGGAERILRELTYN